MSRREFDPEKIQKAYLKEVFPEFETLAKKKNLTLYELLHLAGTLKGLEIPAYNKWLFGWIECPDCEGKGYIFDKIVAYEVSEYEHLGQRTRHDCKDCDGSGKIQRVDSPEFRSEKK